MTTWTQTVDDVPVVDTAAAEESASRLYRVSSLAEAGGDRLESAQAPSWTGQAQQLADGARATASGGFLAVDEAANRLGRAVDTYACDAPTPLRRWRDLVDDLARARAHPVAPGPDGAQDPSAQARVESDLLADIEVQKRLFQRATADLVSHADAVTRGLDTSAGSTTTSRRASGTSSTRRPRAPSPRPSSPSGGSTTRTGGETRSQRPAWALFST